RAKTFYSKVVGLKLVSEDPFALVFDAGGTMFRVAIVEKAQPPAYTVLGWIVPDIRTAVRRITRRGVQFQRYEGMGQDEAGIWMSPSGAKVAWFTDPDGNTLSLTEFPQRGTPGKKRGRLRKADGRKRRR